MDLDKAERMAVLLRVLEHLKTGLEECIIYSDAKDAETAKALKRDANIVRVRNRNQFNGSLNELASLCDKLSDEDVSSMGISVLFKLNRKTTNWRSLFSILYDPGFLTNPRSVMSSAAYDHARKNADDNHAYFILPAAAFQFPEFLVFGKSARENLFSKYAVNDCRISERFRVLYAHFLRTSESIDL